jgi:hypothetical protein
VPKDPQPVKLAKFSPANYFYLASFSEDTLINNDSLRKVLYDINNKLIDESKQKVQGSSWAAALKNVPLLHSISN